MAGYNLDTSGRSPAERRRLEEKRRRARKTNGGTKTERVTTEEVTPKKKVKKDTTPKRSKFGVGSNKIIMRNGKRMANVTKDQLDNTGMTQREYMEAGRLIQLVNVQLVNDLLLIQVVSLG